jgi:hypothetical protein
VARQIAVRARHAVAGDRAEDDAGIHLPQLLEAQTTAVQPSRPHGLNDGIGSPHEVEEDAPPRLGAQVEHDAALAPAELQVHQRDAVHDGPGHLAHVVTLGRLDLHYVRPEVGQRSGDGARSEHGALDHAQRRQRCCHKELCLSLILGIYAIDAAVIASRR